MSKKLGEVIKQLRNNVNLSQAKLAEKTFYSQELISKIEKGTRSISPEMLVILSRVLKYDLVSLAKEIDYFESFEHYKIYNEMVMAIEKQNVLDLVKILDNEIVINEFTYGKVYLKKLYCECAVLAGVYGKPAESLEKCLMILNIDQETLKYFIPKLEQDRDYYACTSVLIKNLHDLKLYNERDIVINNIIFFLEENIFNEFRPISTIDYFWKKYYISTYNNKAQILFEDNQYEDALNICEKIIMYSIELQTLFLLHYLYKLRIEIYLKLNNYEKASELIKKFEHTCFFNNALDYFEQTLKEFNNKYF